ncbi:MAG: hypothetical protein AAGB02_03240 [Pseudomonadota bacterium]
MALTWNAHYYEKWIDNNVSRPDAVDLFIHELRALCKKREEDILTPCDLAYSLRLVANEIDTGEVYNIRGG